MAEQRLPKSEVYCSFCGKSQHKVAKIVAGPSVFICNACIDLAYQIVHTEQPAPVTNG